MKAGTSQHGQAGEPENAFQTTLAVKVTAKFALEWENPSPLELWAGMPSREGISVLSCPTNTTSPPSAAHLWGFHENRALFRGDTGSQWPWLREWHRAGAQCPPRLCPTNPSVHLGFPGKQLCVHQAARELSSSSQHSSHPLQTPPFIPQP